MRGPRPAAALSFAVVGAAFAHLVDATWLRWGDPVVDCGRELEVAHQIAAGQALYADVRYYYGPLAPWLNGALFRLLGVHLSVLLGAGLASVAAMTLALHALARRRAGWLVATVVALAFLYLCAFGHYYWFNIFQWVFPYTYAATYGMLAATASLLWLVRHVETGAHRDLLLSLVFLGLAALAKIEAFVPAAAAHFVFVVVERPRLGPYVALAVAGLAVAASFWLALGSAVFADYFRVALDPTTRPSLLAHMGLSNPGNALRAVGRTALPLGIVLGLCTIAAWGVRRAGGQRPLEWLAGAICAVAAWRAYRDVGVFDQLRVLPVVLLAVALAGVLGLRATGAEHRGALARLLLAVFALACLPRMPLSTGPFHYGFYLLPVPLLVFVAAFFDDLPRLLPGRPRHLVAIAGVGLLATIGLVHHRASQAMYAHHRTPIETARGRLIILSDLGGFPVGPAYAGAVAFLAREPPGTRVLVVPEGIGLAFLAGLEGVCGMHSFLPPELVSPFEARLLACLDAAPPELIVRIRINLEEYGARAFGGDYARSIAHWVNTRYVPVTDFGPAEYVRVLRRR